jgi:hypothetical protein
LSRVALHHTLVHGTFTERRGAREETRALCLLSTIYGQESQVMQGSMEPTVSDLVMLLKTLDCDRRDVLTAVCYGTTQPRGSGRTQPHSIVALVKATGGRNVSFSGNRAVVTLVRMYPATCRRSKIVFKPISALKRSYRGETTPRSFAQTCTRA